VALGAGSFSQEAQAFVEGTILRIRGSLDVPKSTTIPGTGAITVAFGIGFVTDEAFAAGGLPNPATNEGVDWDGWMFYRSNVQGSLDANAGIVDSKSMRRWQGGMTLAFIAGGCSDEPTGFTGFNVQAILRLLILLP